MELRQDHAQAGLSAARLKREWRRIGRVDYYDISISRKYAKKMIQSINRTLTSYHKNSLIRPASQNDVHERRLIRSISDFRRHYRQLSAGDLVLGVLSVQSGEEIKILDLATRGVAFFPAVLCQLLAAPRRPRLKFWRTIWFLGVLWPMPCRIWPRTSPNLKAVKQWWPSGTGAIWAWGSASGPHWKPCTAWASLQGLTYPLVVQPLLVEARDVRVVVLGDYVEAYERFNPHNFRKNLFQGGSSQPLGLAPELEDFCRVVMARGKFPYAILDLLLDPADCRPYVSEISFKGGLTGSRLSQAEFRARVAALEEEFCRTWENSSKTLP